ncbi:MAG: ribonuclease III [Ignavibacteriales bacterium]|nr:ribonuclease III [Ignavibacteriales bacterium]
MNALFGWVARLFRDGSSDNTLAYTALASKANLKRLERSLQYRIRNKAFFVQALLHRSYLQYAGSADLQSNERLEFFGDAILSVVVAEYLLEKFPRAEEGELTVFRSRLVNRKALANFASTIQLKDHLIVSNSATQAMDKGCETMLADAFEALLAAMYLDGGLEPVRRFVYRCLAATMDNGFLLTPNENYKSALLEYGQSHGRGIPRYVIVNEEGPDHERVFTAEAFFGDDVIGRGTGKNKKEAEQSAAAQAMAALDPSPFIDTSAKNL